MINIAEILKDCPKGTKLYSPICGECRLIKIYNGLGFDVINGTNDIFNFSYDGRYNLNGECCIFPSKEQRDWSKFQKPFKDGDIVFYSNTIAIFKEWGDETLFRTYCVFYTTASNPTYQFEIGRPLFGKGIRREARFATEEEKQKLFKAIKENGYKWNAEAKTLDKLIVPEFKVGDIVYNRLQKRICIYHYGEDEVPCISHCRYNEYHKTFEMLTDNLCIAKQDYRLATEEEKVKLFNAIKANGYRWNAETKTLEKLVTIFKVGDRIKLKNVYAKKYNDFNTRDITEIKDSHYILDDEQAMPLANQYLYELVPNKFDITTLKPFESRVLVRDVDHYEWEGAIFGRYDGKNFFTIGGLDWGCCIPYEGNEHLLGKTDDCDEYYKNW